jgi:hypothetical protein
VGKITTFPDIRLPRHTHDHGADDDYDAAFTFTLPRFLGCGRATTTERLSGSSASASSTLTPPYRRYWAVVVFSNYMIDYDLLFQRLLPPHFWLGADFSGPQRITLRPPRFIFLHGDDDCGKQVVQALDGALRLWHRWLQQQVYEHSSATVEWVLDDATLGESSRHPLGPASTYEAFSAFVRGRFAAFRPPLPVPFGTHHTKAVFAFTHDPLISVGAVASSCPGPFSTPHRHESTPPPPIRNGMRVIIGTSNFICDDLERKGQMWYCQDFPRVSNTAPVGASQATSGTTTQLDTVIRRHGFGIALSEYFSFALDSESPVAQRLGAEYAAALAKTLGGSAAPSGISVSTVNGYLPAFRALLPQVVACWYDYSAAAALIVSSFPGAHQAAATARGGHAEVVGRVLAREGLASAAVAATVGRPYRGLWGAATALVLCEALAAARRKQEHGKKVAATAVQHQRALVWQYTSQGSLTENFLNDLARALSYPYPLLGGMGDTVGGAEGAAAAKGPHRRRARSPAPGGPAASIAPETSDDVGVSRVDVVIPTEYEVRTSIEGWRGGLSIPIPMKNMTTLLNDRLHRYTPRGAPDPTVALAAKLREVHASAQRAAGAGGPPRSASTNPPVTHLYSRAMPHIKTFLRVVRQTPRAATTVGQPVDGWAEWLMPTSCNLSRAAWGDPQKQGAQLLIRSYEMGVVVHPALLPPVAPARGTAAPASRHTHASATAASAASDRHSVVDADDDDDECVEIFPAAPLAASPAPHAARVTSFLTPDHPLRVPGCLDAAALEVLRMRFGLHAVALGAPSAKPDVPRRVVFLPYDPIHPQPYRGLGGAQSQQQQQEPAFGADGAPVRDVPWAIDYPHRGRDLLGRTFQEIVEGGYVDHQHIGVGALDLMRTPTAPPYSHYGPTSWLAPVLEL